MARTAEEALQVIANLVAIRHQIDSGLQAEMAQRREDLLECIAYEVREFASSVDVM